MSVLSCADERCCNGRNWEIRANNRTEVALGRFKTHRHLLQGLQCDPITGDHCRLRHLQILNGQSQLRFTVWAWL